MSAGAGIYRQLPSTKQRSSSEMLRLSQIGDVEKIKNCCTKSNQDLQELHKSNHGSRIRMAGNTTKGNTRKRQACKRYRESSTESPQLKRNRSSANGKGRELRITNAQSPQLLLSYYYYENNMSYSYHVTSESLLRDLPRE
jgi:hypothetical protein